MNRTLIASLHTLFADPDNPDHDTLFAVLADMQAPPILGCLAPPGSLVQITAALWNIWSWDCDGWERQIDKLVNLITEPRCPSPGRMIATWRYRPSAVGVLHDRTDTLIAWGRHQLHPEWYANLAILLGPSNASARLLVQSPSSDTIGRTLQRWSTVIDPDDPTAWQAMIDPNLRAALHQRANPSLAFPAWGWEPSVDPETVLTQIVNDLLNGWSPDHPSIRGRIGWIETHVDSNLSIAPLSVLASIGRSEALVDAVCVRILHHDRVILDIAPAVPWSRLHPRIQTVIDETMRQASDRWKRTWACAIGHEPVLPDTSIDSRLLFWRIARTRWDDLDPPIRAALLARVMRYDHCCGWGVHPDLVTVKSRPNGREFRYWNPDVPPDDLRAWTYADVLRAQPSLQKARDLIVLLAGLPPDRRAQFAQIIDWRLNGRTEPNAQPPWDWTTWASLPAADRQRRLRARLRVLWGNRTTAPAYRAWMGRSHLLDTVVIAVRDLLDSKHAPHTLAALLAQIPALQVHMPNHGPPLPFPNDLDSARRAQITRLPLAPDAQAYAAWCLRVLDQDMVPGSTLIALHPTIAVVLAPVLTDKQRADVAASPAAQGWDSITILRWEAICASAKELPMLPIQRRIA